MPVIGNQQTFFKNPTDTGQVTPTTWAEALLRSMGLPMTQQNVKIIIAWEAGEGGHWANSAKYNPLNTTQSEPGSSTFQSVGIGSAAIRIYTSWDQGIQATVTTLNNGNYSGILAMLKLGNASSAAAASAINNSVWGTKDLTASLIDGAQITGGQQLAATPGGTANAGGTGVLLNDSSGFRVGDTTNPDEDFWTAMNRLAQERYWYLFCMALDTPVPTPEGWTTIEELQVGDAVLGSNGQPVRVTAVSPIRLNHECFRVEFLDGSSIVADADHRWQTLSLGSSQSGAPKPGKTDLKKIGNRYLGIRTTREIAETVRYGSHKYNHRIPSAPYLELPEAELPIDAYIFGYWLGDGSKTAPRITVGDVDHDHVVAEVERAGLTVMNDQRTKWGWSHVHITNGKRGELPKRLRSLGVYDNKHIPTAYLRSSRVQREALLQGLMDSDGSTGRNSSFGNTNHRLVQDVYELLGTLGVRGFRRKIAGGKRIKMPGGHTSVAAELHSISFAPTPEVRPFRLPRKLQIYEERLRAIGIQRGTAHTITAVVPVDSVPVRCIQVDATDKLFLTGDALVPTHNSDAETLYLADGPDLMKQTPAAQLDRIADAAAINHLSFTFDNCLALDTPIPTPMGWKTMEELRVGDLVFAPDGKPTKVLRASPIHHDRTCYRVRFDDKTSIVADEGHLWETTASKRDSKTITKVAHQSFLGVRTTDDIRKTLFAGERRRPMRNHHVRLAQPLELPEQDLPIDPYVLGYWLGDGYHHQPAISASHEDADALVAELVGAGYSVKDQRFSTGTGFSNKGGAYVSFALYPEYRKAQRGEDSITRRLRALGVWRNKHIPTLYLRSARTQRLSLLQGIMDADGTIGNRCEITLHNERLSLDVLELVRSLGYKPYWGSYEPRPPAKRAFRVAFATRPKMNCFRLRRKATKYITREDSKAHLGKPHRMIIAVEPVASVPVRCIEVDSKDHLYLAGEGMVPTHNTAWLYAATHKRRKRAQRRTSLPKVVSPVEGSLHAICAIDAVRAGDVINMSSCGPGDGQWLVGDCRRSVFEIMSEINLVQALTPLTEGQLHPANANPLNQINPTGATGTAKKALSAAIAAIGGPYSQAFHDAVNDTAAQIRQHGTDCSGYISYLMGPNGLGIWSQSYATPAIPTAPGLGGGAGPQITIYNNPLPGNSGHVWIQILHRYFECAGGIGVHEMSIGEVNYYLGQNVYVQFHPLGL